MKEGEKPQPILRKAMKFWLPVVLWAIVIFTFSAQPANPVSEIHWQDFIVKKTAHVVEYAVFTFLLYRAFWGSGLTVKRSLYLSFFIALFYGFTDELHQSFTPGRDPKLRDVFFDGTGALTSTLLISKVLPNSNDKIKKLAKSFDII